MTCSNCHSQVAEAAKFCASCGAAIGGALCPSCGATVRAGAKFCAKCGATVRAGAEEPVGAATTPQKSRRRPAWQATLLPVLIIPVLVVIFFLLSHNKEKPQGPAPGGPISMSGAEQGGVAPDGQGTQTGGMDEVYQQINSFKSALQANPRDTTALAGLGQVYEMATKFPEAADYYRRYLEVSPGNADVRMSLAGVYFNQQDLGKAEAEINQVLRQRPNYDYALYNLGVIYAAAQRKDEAIKAWHRVMELSPGSVLAQKSAANIGSTNQ